MGEKKKEKKISKSESEINSLKKERDDFKNMLDNMGREPTNVI